MTKELSSRYIEGIGRRKTAVARVRITKGKGVFVINDKSLESYFPGAQLQAVVQAPLRETSSSNFDVSVRVNGGGIQAQSEAIRHGLSRALVTQDADFKKRLRSAGFLTRDSRMVERKKYGLKKARRAPQWAKR